MRWACVLLLSTGCSSILGIDDFKLGDAGTGGEAIETGYCLGPTGFRICVPEEPTKVMPLDSPLNFSTDGSALCAMITPPKSWTDAGQRDACFLIYKQITISAMIRATGKRPLVIFASDSITIGAPIDVASHGVPPNVTTGPGIDLQMPMTQGACTPPIAAASAGAGAGPGGAGGSFMRKGGNGGPSSSAGGTVGRAAEQDTAAPTLLRPGCNGGKGADSTEQGGSGGIGGGAIYLVAGNRININSFINASGSAGNGAGRQGGGGGGGSGGMIVLHAPMIIGNGGVLIANGGGAGSGGAGSLGGTAGAEPSPNMPSVIAQGGSNTGGGGAGGAGFAGSMDATTGQMGSPTAANGGGGGGGGAGYIRVNTAPSQVTASPAISMP